jgi:hypothetical protein
MKMIMLIAAILFMKISLAQTTIDSKSNGMLQFVELDHGTAEVVDGKVEKLTSSPTGTHGWLADFVITKVTDSVHLAIKTNFGVVYQVKAKDTVDIDVIIEWIYPVIITNEEGKKFKSIKYTTHRPTNIPSASSYSLDAPYELVKGDWKLNMYIEDKLMYTKIFFLY